jgi:hypothetical protein
VAAYNWYPLLVMMAPALVVASLRAIRGSQGRARYGAIAFVGLTAIAYVMPYSSFSHRGVGWLNSSGGGIAPPCGLLILAIGGLMAAALVRQVTRPDLMTNVIVAAPAVLGGGAVALIAAYEAHSSGVVSYYGQKIGAAVFAVCTIVLVSVMAHHLVTSEARRRFPVPLAATLSVLVTVAALQIDGYVGPVPGTLQSTYTAPGITLRDALYALPSRPVDGQRLLLAAQTANLRPGHWWFLEPNPPSGNTWVLMTQWLWSLQGEFATSNTVRSTVPLELDGTATPHQLAHAIVADFADPGGNGYHLFVPKWLKRAIVRRDPAWAHPGWLLVIPALGSASPS